MVTFKVELFYLVFLLTSIDNGSLSESDLSEEPLGEKSGP